MPTMNGTPRQRSAAPRNSAAPATTAAAMYFVHRLNPRIANPRRGVAVDHHRTGLAFGQRRKAADCSAASQSGVSAAPYQRS
jgi:hypothetical protein